MKKLYVFLLSFLFIFYANAQCPVANSCTPGTAPAGNHIFGMGILSVTIGSGPNGFSNTTGGVTDGYQDYSCTKKATVSEGVPTAISITTNPNVNENVRVWVDLNNNGTFEVATELLFSSNNAINHNGTFTIPVSASVVKNQVLRMRISADNFSSPVPTPCSTPVYSQVEDYGITVQSNTNKPTVNFSVNNPITCSPTVQFQSLIQNGATSYFWEFGDNTTSTAANPSHTYGTTGTYTVKLKACNAAGCDSLTKTNYVTYHTNVPVATSCTPITTNHCCGYGITKVTFHTLVNASANGSAGYEDFTCSKSVTVQAGQNYNLSLETSTANNQDTWAYIDFNNDGTFSNSELVFTKLNAKNPSGNIFIQAGALQNVPLRFRIISDEQGAATGPCSNRTSGQVEDYSLTVIAPLQKPVPYFSSNHVGFCDTLVQFTDSSLFAPSSYTWDFGDGSPRSHLQNPLHNYAASGVYTVKLTTCNSLGCDSITKTNLIAIN
ncbi:PKD domain-containing protein, partial [Adhaeribacter soli]